MANESNKTVKVRRFKPVPEYSGIPAVLLCPEI